ncbi:MAG: hypothetical protein GXP14_07550 [Gammaproteobacteria bacterium]|nr:hypothetical protein [Gammaproteobacteria bacterium]
MPTLRLLEVKDKYRETSAPTFLWCMKNGWLRSGLSLGEQKEKAPETKTSEV